MIASLPLELAGVFIALWIAHQSFSTVSILGIIVLTGMDITTAVLLIDMIMKYRDRASRRMKNNGIPDQEVANPSAVSQGSRDHHWSEGSGQPSGSQRPTPNAQRRFDDRELRDEAIAQACPQRLRPILMTAGITMIVMLPIALAPKTGLDAYQPLGTTVVGGLLVGTILSLFDIPIMHTYVDDFTRWLNKTFLGREWKWTPPEGTEPNEHAESVSA
jgi:HAE1 family hydrophobic/amphiphilic exporter-1